MADVTISPNMGLPIPTVGQQVGPEWANNIVACLYAIDAHAHSSGQGVSVTPDGLDINSELSFGGFDATNLRTSRYEQQAAALSAPTDLDCVYDVMGDLYFNDGAGNQVRITQGGAVTGATGTITGLPSGTASASFAAGTFTFQSATNTPATMAVGPLQVGAAVASSNTVTIAPPNTLAASYSWTLPDALPSATYPVTVTSAGVLANSGTISLANGSAGSPSLTFASDTDTGIFRSGTNQVAIATNASQRVTISPNTVTSTLPFQGPNGSSTTPAFGFSGDTNTGMFAAAADTLAFATGGSEQLRISTQIESSSSGSAAAPAYTFDGDEDSGFYRVSANNLGITTGGAQRLAIGSSGLDVTGRVTSTTTMAAGTSMSVGTTLAVGTSINIASGGAFKVAVYTGSLSSGASTDLTPGGTVYGVFGWSSDNGTTNYTVMGNTSSSSDIYIPRTSAQTTSNVRLTNGQATSRNYRAVVFYA